MLAPYESRPRDFHFSDRVIGSATTAPEAGSRRGQQEGGPNPSAQTASQLRERRGEPRTRHRDRRGNQRYRHQSSGAEELGCVGPTRDLADLGVRVALRLECQSANLLRLQGIERLPAPNDALTPGELVIGARTLRCDQVERISLVVVIPTRKPGRAEQPLSLAA